MQQTLARVLKVNNQSGIDLNHIQKHVYPPSYEGYATVRSLECDEMRNNRAYNAAKRGCAFNKNEQWHRLRSEDLVDYLRTLAFDGRLDTEVLDRTSTPFMTDNVKARLRIAQKTGAEKTPTRTTSRIKFQNARISTLLKNMQDNHPSVDINHLKSFRLPWYKQQHPQRGAVGRAPMTRPRRMNGRGSGAARGASDGRR